MVDGESLTARLCAEGMTVDGDPVAAHALFVQAWEARRDAYDAAIGAHFLARHQPSPELVLYWNRIAVDNALADGTARVQPLLASLFLNLGDSYLRVDQLAESATAVRLGAESLAHLPPGGYRDFVAMGLERLRARIGEAHSV